MKLPWYMRQRRGALLVAGLGGLFTVVQSACGEPWAASTAPNLPWRALASSSDGVRMVAAANAAGYFVCPPAPIYVSSDAGGTWVQTSAPSNNWSSVACSADGAKLVAAASPVLPERADCPVGGDGLIYTSADRGGTWRPTSAPSNNWTCVASSADGAKLVAVTAPYWDTNRNCVGEGAIYRSGDAGATWLRSSAPSNYWTSVASSADGAKLVAVAPPNRDTNSNYVGEGVIYCSSDSGATWRRVSAPSTNWSCVASSADGARLVAAAGPMNQSPGLIYTSTNSGASWRAATAPSGNWLSLACSADAAKLVAVSPTVSPEDPLSSMIYTSTDSGATWASTGPFFAQWTAVACSADGYRVVVGGYTSSLYTLPYSGPWKLADVPAIGWATVAASADGTELVAAAYGGPIYRSVDSGARWSATSAPIDCWISLASSADGTKLAAASHCEAGCDGLIYTSNDSGMTWVRTGAPRNWWDSVTCSADGKRLLAVAGTYLPTGGPELGDGGTYRSSDSGATWTRLGAPSNEWSWVKFCVNGDSAAGAVGGLIYLSSDSGATWRQSGLPSNQWDSVVFSLDGTKLAASGAGGIWLSTNSGAAWTETTPPGIGDEILVPSGAAGFVAAAGGQVYVSTSAGDSWVATDPPAGVWGGIAASADGSVLVAASFDGLLCVRGPSVPAPPLPPSPRLSIDRWGASIGISWLVPSTRFVLQQVSDLNFVEWSDVPLSPTLNFTNLHYQLTLPARPGGGFYRLKQQ